MPRCIESERRSREEAARGAYVSSAGDPLPPPPPPPPSLPERERVRNRLYELILSVRPHIGMHVCRLIRGSNGYRSGSEGRGGVGEREG